MNEACYYRVSIKGIVVDESGRFLLAREENGKWELLGGGLNHGEEPIDGLKREIKEETGLDITHVSNMPKYFITSKRLGRDAYLANVIYEIKLKDFDFTPSNECRELRYLDVAAARLLDLYPNVEKFLDVYDPAKHIHE